MAQGVIDELEPVDVAHEHTDAFDSVALQSLGFFFEIGPVVNAGKGIVQAEKLQALFIGCQFFIRGAKFPVGSRQFGITFLETLTVLLQFRHFFLQLADQRLVMLVHDLNNFG